MGTLIFRWAKGQLTASCVSERESSTLTSVAPLCDLWPASKLCSLVGALRLCCLERKKAVSVGAQSSEETNDAVSGLTAAFLLLRSGLLLIQLQKCIFHWPSKPFLCPSVSQPCFSPELSFAILILFTSDLQEPGCLSCGRMSLAWIHAWLFDYTKQQGWGCTNQRGARSGDHFICQNIQKQRTGTGK